MYKAFVKPFFDFITALIALLILSPVFIIISVLLLISTGKSPFFLQKRPGKNERIFTIFKFKTMNDARTKNGELLADEDRLTGLGKFIRKTSLDEIPQLINVIKGDMSLVGPRPLLPEYLELYNDFQKRRHLVKPGITGYAQVSGRNALSWEKKFELDVEYVKRLSFALDLKILLRTISKVFSGSDINAMNSATTERFKGNEQ